MTKRVFLEPCDRHFSKASCISIQVETSHLVLSCTIQSYDALKQIDSSLVCLLAKCNRSIDSPILYTHLDGLSLLEIWNLKVLGPPCKG